MLTRETKSLLLGLGLVGGIGYLLARYTGRSALLELRGGDGAASLPRPEAVLPPVLGPTRLREPFGLVPGGRYVAAIDVSFPLSTTASASSVESEARSLGFADARASRTRPSSPAIAEGDYYIEGTYGGAPRSFPRSNARGLVTITDAWRVA